MSDNFLNNDEFSFYVPLEVVEKSTSSTDKKDNRRIVQGIASTDHLDLQGEVVKQSGLDFSYFLSKGWINDDHKPGPENKVGEPLEAKITPAGFWIKALIYKGQERSDYWWKFLHSLEQSEANRKVGFSIQGKITRREGKSITSCMITEVAITASPVNTHTWAEIAKSLSEQTFCKHPWKSLEKACKGCPGVTTCPSTTMNTTEEDEEKALSVGGMGKPLVPQSLEGSNKVTTYKSINTISYEEAVNLLQIEKGYSKQAAETIAKTIFATNGAF